MFYYMIVYLRWNVQSFWFGLHLPVYECDGHDLLTD